MKKTTLSIISLLTISTSAGAQGVQCMPCLAGTYAAAGATECKPCPYGTYQPNIMAGSCITCPGGKYCPSGASAPQTCPGGKYCPLEGRATECPIDHYCPQGSTSPIICPSGYKSIVSSSSCTKCPSYTQGPIAGGNNYFNRSNSFIYCKLHYNGDCVLDLSQSHGGCVGSNYSGSNYCSDTGSNGVTLRDLANSFCANGGSF
jgi:hypothetical protein